MKSSDFDKQKQGFLKQSVFLCSSEAELEGFSLLITGTAMPNTSYDVFINSPMAGKRDESLSKRQEVGRLRMSTESPPERGRRGP